MLCCAVAFACAVLQTGKLEPQPGRTLMEAFEGKVNSVLNKARDDAGMCLCVCVCVWRFGVGRRLSQVWLIKTSVVHSAQSSGHRHCPGYRLMRKACRPARAPEWLSNHSYALAHSAQHRTTPIVLTAWLLLLSLPRSPVQAKPRRTV